MDTEIGEISNKWIKCKRNCMSGHTPQCVPWDCDEFIEGDPLEIQKQRAGSAWMCAILGVNNPAEICDFTMENDPENNKRSIGLPISEMHRYPKHEIAILEALNGKREWGPRFEIFYPNW